MKPLVCIGEIFLNMTKLKNYVYINFLMHMHEI